MAQKCATTETSWADGTREVLDGSGRGHSVAATMWYETRDLRLGHSRDVRERIQSTGNRRAWQACVAVGWRACESCPHEGREAADRGICRAMRERRRERGEGRRMEMQLESTGRETGRLAKRERASVFYIALLCVPNEVSVLVGYCVVSGQSHA